MDMLHNDQKLLHSCIVYQRTTYTDMAKKYSKSDKGSGFSDEESEKSFEVCYTATPIHHTMVCMKMNKTSFHEYYLCNDCEVEMEINAAADVEMYCPECGIIKKYIYLFYHSL